MAVQLSVLSHKRRLGGRSKGEPRVKKCENRRKEDTEAKSTGNI